MRDVTIFAKYHVPGLSVSTHTPHAGRDATDEEADEYLFGFYSHAPCGT